MQVWNSLCIAFAMYSKIPVPQADWEEKNMQYVMCCFPLVGGVIGLAVCLTAELMDWFLVGASFRAVVLLLVPVAVTGGIHLDGFLDTVDARSAYLSKERRLEILKDPHAGAFAVLGACVYFLLDYGVWTEVRNEMLPVLACSFCFSRVLSAYAVLSWKNARGTGLAAGFQEASAKRSSKMILLIEGLILLSVMVFLHWREAAAAVIAAAICYLYYHYMAFREFGGITGDLAGWFLQVCELGMAAAIVIGDKVWY